MNQLCIVTGGANGIGAGIVRRLHDDGYAVLFCDVDTKNGEALSRELSSDNHVVHFIPCDIKSVANVNQMIEAARGLKLPIYSLINNAGIFPPDDSWRSLFKSEMRSSRRT